MCNISGGQGRRKCQVMACLSACTAGSVVVFGQHITLWYRFWWLSVDWNAWALRVQMLCQSFWLPIVDRISWAWSKGSNSVTGSDDCLLTGFHESEERALTLYYMFWWLSVDRNIWVWRKGSDTITCSDDCLLTGIHESEERALTLYYRFWWLSVDRNTWVWRKGSNTVLQVLMIVCWQEYLSFK